VNSEKLLGGGPRAKRVFIVGDHQPVAQKNAAFNESFYAL
jgi:hypothetical protein